MNTTLNICISLLPFWQDSDYNTADEVMGMYGYIAAYRNATCEHFAFLYEFNDYM